MDIKIIRTEPIKELPSALSFFNSLNIGEFFIADEDDFRDEFRIKVSSTYFITHHSGIISELIKAENYLRNGVEYKKVKIKNIELEIED